MSVSSPPSAAALTDALTVASGADVDAREHHSETVALASCWLIILLPLGLILGIYWSLWPALASVWETDPNYSHGFIIPPVAVLFAWLGWQRFGSPVSSNVARRYVIEGTLLIAAGLVLHVAVWMIHNLFLDVLSLIVMLRGLLLVWGGPRAKKAFGMSAWFLIFMAPLPIHWYQPIAIRMQQLVTDLSTLLLEVCAVPVYREGYLIHLPGYTMAVAAACSGLRQLTAILALAVAIGYFSGRGRGFCWILALLAVPIAVVSNCIRVVLSGIILTTFGRKWAEGVFHTIEGLGIVALSAVLLVFAAWALEKFVPGSESRAPAVAEQGAASG